VATPGTIDNSSRESPHSALRRRCFPFGLSAGKEADHIPSGIQDLGDLDITTARDLGMRRGFGTILSKNIGYGADIIHAGPITDCAYIATAEMTLPVVACSWAFDVLFEVRQSSLSKRRAALALRRCQALIVDCQTVLNRCEELAARDFKAVAMLPWGLDVKYSASGVGDFKRIRRDLGWEDAIVILSTRSLEPLYDLPTILSAFKLAVNHDCRMRLLLVGEGSRRDQLQKLAKSLKITDLVHFAGSVARSQMSDYFSAADIYASCALVDGSSVSLLEAMAQGALPVVSDLPSNREWIKQGITGWLALADPRGNFPSPAVCRFNFSPEKQCILSKNRKSVKKNANWRRISAKYTYI